MGLLRSQTHRQMQKGMTECILNSVRYCNEWINQWLHCWFPHWIVHNNIYNYVLNSVGLDTLYYNQILSFANLATLWTNICNSLQFKCVIFMYPSLRDIQIESAGPATYISQSNECIVDSPPINSILHFTYFANAFLARCHWHWSLKYIEVCEILKLNLKGVNIPIF